MVLRRISVEPDGRWHTAAKQLSHTAVPSPQATYWDLHRLHEEAFDVEAVTREFCGGYKGVFRLLQGDLLGQHNDPHWAHDLALQS